MNRIAELRKSMGLTQKELAKQLKISPVTLSRYETGERVPGFDVLKKMSEIFDDVPVEFIMKNTDADNLAKTLDSFINMTDEITSSIYKQFIRAFTKLNDSGKKELFKYSDYLASQEEYKEKEINMYVNGEKVESSTKNFDIKFIKKEKKD